MSIHVEEYEDNLPVKAAGSHEYKFVKIHLQHKPIQYFVWFFRRALKNSTGYKQIGGALLNM